MFAYRKVGRCADVLAAYNAKNRVQEWAVSVNGNNPIHSREVTEVKEYDVIVAALTESLLI